ncbi:Vacuolar protein sorting-associated protein 62 [Phaffia rhodozyma]|uniref:Vacuolar protein sorting-associated protein 62 n=1 Tax=Phaffia rhodozyma TaxID=264483 RepID=A0A0F7SHG6_PHARH|nr:Vacuolar protein sorting-associated protein 62 [Phaffia rhodozyma]
MWITSAAPALNFLYILSSITSTAGLPFDQIPFVAESSGVTTATNNSNNDDTTHNLARKFAPIIYLAKDERFFPASIDYFLPSLTALHDDSSRPVSRSPTSLNSTNLDRLPYHGSGVHLAINSPPAPSAKENAYNAQPFFPPARPGEIDERVYGNQHRPIGDWSSLAVAVEKSKEGVVDLYYWTYYPYNFGKFVGARVGWVGNHISDWECMMVRTVDGEPISVDYLSHTGRFNYGTMPWNKVTKEDGRPVGYAAMGSHGLWPTEGEHVYASAFKYFKLVDSTSRGQRWDTLLDQRFLPYWEETSTPAHRRRKVYRGPDSWANFKGRWGDDGERTCWWWKIYPGCQMVDGPQGPIRDSMRDPPQCVLPSSYSTIASNTTPSFTMSTYSISLSAHLVSSHISRTSNSTSTSASTAVGVRQLCRRNGFDSSNTREDEIPPYTLDHKKVDLKGRAGEEIIWSWVPLSGSTSPPSDGSSTEGRLSEIIEVQGCKKGYHVASYGVALSTFPPPSAPSYSSGECESCSFLPDMRDICVSRNENNQSSNPQAIVIDDLDAWGWEETTY